jgi:putative ABC transport system ATP-binding protein
VTAARPVLVVQDVSKRFRRGPETVLAVDGVSFSVDAFRMASLEGRSGSGKTTLLDVVLGWTQADSGLVEGVPAVNDWSALAVIPQRLGLLDHLTLHENVDLPSRVGGRRRTHPAGAGAGAAMEQMEWLGIAHLADRFPFETSLGEQQRAACARALVSRPRLLIADEPTSHQDDASARRMIERLVDAVQQGTAILVATHDDRVSAAADQVLYIEDGRLRPAAAAS